MTIKERIDELIQIIQEQHCKNCEHGQCIIDLDQARKHVPIAAAAPETATDKESLSDRTIKKSLKARPAIKKSHPAGGVVSKGGKRDAILEYLKAHGDGSSNEIAKGLGITRAATVWNLSDMRSQGLVEMVGKSSNARWRLDGKPVMQSEETPAAPPAEPPMSKEASKPFACEICDKRFYVRGSLIEHMRMRHPKGAAA